MKALDPDVAISVAHGAMGAMRGAIWSKIAPVGRRSPRRSVREGFIFEALPTSAIRSMLWKGDAAIKKVQGKKKVPVRETGLTGIPRGPYWS